MSEIYPKQSLRLGPERPPLSEVSIICLSPLDKALLEPLSDFAPITSQELQLMGHLSKDDISSHFLTTLILRLAGDSTTIKDYDSYIHDKDYNKIIQNKSDTSKETKAYYNQQLELSAIKACPYTVVRDTVIHYRDKYLEAYQSFDNPTERREFTATIYEKSDHFKHPGLSYLEQQRQQPREDLRSAVIESERLFRSMLIDAASDNGSTT